MNVTSSSGINSTNNQTAPGQCNGWKTVKFDRITSVVITIIATCLLNVIFAIFAIASNSLSLVALYRKASLRTPANLIITSMSISDLLVGLLVQTIYVILRLHELGNIHLCPLKRFFAFLGYFCSGVSMLTICSFSLDRYFAVCFPYRYIADTIYVKYAAWVIFFWTSWLAYTLLPFAGVISPKKFHSSLSIVMFLSISISVICYLKIYLVIRRHRRKICASIPAPSIEPSDIQDVRNKKCDLKWLKFQRRKSFTTLVIVCTFVACFIPKIITLVANLLLGDTLDVLYVSGKWSDTVIFINSSLNPIIYIIRLEEIRQEIIAILKKLRSKILRPADCFH